MSFEYDDEPPRRSSAIDMAYEIVDMHRKLERLQGEVFELQEYKQKYFDLLNQSVAHGEHMIGGLLTLALKLGDDEANRKGA